MRCQPPKLRDQLEKEPVKFRDLPLPRGYAKVISVKLQCSLEKVYHVRTGYTQCDEIKLELLKLAVEEHKRRKKIEEEKSKVLDLFDFEITL